MTITAAPPPTRASAAPSAGSRAPDAPPVLDLLLASRPERERRAVALSLAGAIAAHLLLLLILLLSGPLGGRWFPNLPVARSADEPTITILFPGMDVSGAGRASMPAPAPVAEGVEAPLVTPRHIPSAIPGLPRPGAPGEAAGAGAGAAAGQGGAGAGAGEGGANMSAAERLRPHGWDRRLWESPDQLAPGESDNARVAGRIQRRIDQYNDSLNAVAAAERKGKDWTVKDKNGKSWGIGSDGKLQLGGLTLPLLGLPSGQFTAPPGRRDEFERNQANWDAIQRSATNAEIRHTFDDRVKAIRQRKDAEKKKDDTSKDTKAQ